MSRLPACAITGAELKAATEAARAAFCLITRDGINVDPDGRLAEDKEKRTSSDKRQRSEEHERSADERHWTAMDEAGRKEKKEGEDRRRRGEEAVNPLVKHLYETDGSGHEKRRMEVRRQRKEDAV